MNKTKGSEDTMLMATTKKLLNTVLDASFIGCRMCYKQDDINPLTGDKMNVLYEKTMRKEANLKQMGYNVKAICVKGG